MTEPSLQELAEAAWQKKKPDWSGLEEAGLFKKIFYLGYCAAVEDIIPDQNPDDYPVPLEPAPFAGSDDLPF